MLGSLGSAIATALGPVGAVLGTALVLWLPGYALTAALFPRGHLRGDERLLVSVGLSLTLAILAGFVLSELGIRLTGSTWVVGLMGVTLAAGAVAWRDPFHRPVRPRLREWVPQRGIEVVMLGVAAALVVVAIIVARIGASEQPQTGFTELWMLPAPGDGVRVGLDSHEANAMTYRVVLKDGSAVITEWPSVQLTPGQDWNAEVALPASVNSGLELLLYRSASPGEVYRRAAMGPFATP